MPPVKVEEREVRYRCLICPERDEAATWAQNEGLAATHQRETGHPVELKATRIVRLGLASPVPVPSA